MKKNKKCSNYLFSAMLVIAAIGVLTIFIVMIKNNEKLASDIMMAMGFWVMIFSIKPVYTWINKFLQGGKFGKSAWIIIVIAFLALLSILLLTTFGLYKTFNISTTCENYITFIFMLISVFINVSYS